jgi:hypothetical protein
MRHMISGLVAAIAVMTVGAAAPAMACGGGGLFQSACSPCGEAYIPCVQPQVYVAPVEYSGCNSGCGGWARERLPDPVHQYYYVNQGPTYTGPGNWAPRVTYEEEGVVEVETYGRPQYGYTGGRYADVAVEAPVYHRPWRHSPYHYGYAPRRHSYGMGSRGYYEPRHSMRYGAPMYARHGYRDYPVRRYN